MGVVEGTGQVADDFGGAAEAGPILVDQRLQRAALDVDRGDVVVPAVAAGVVDGDDVRVAQAGSGLGLAEEPRSGLRSSHLVPVIPPRDAANDRKPGASPPGAGEAFPASDGVFSLDTAICKLAGWPIEAERKAADELAARAGVHGLPQAGLFDGEHGRPSDQPAAGRRAARDTLPAGNTATRFLWLERAAALEEICGEPSRPLRVLWDELSRHFDFHEVDESSPATGADDNRSRLEDAVDAALEMLQP